MGQSARQARQPGRRRACGAHRDRWPGHDLDRRRAAAARDHARDRQAGGGRKRAASRDRSMRPQAPADDARRPAPKTSPRCWPGSTACAKGSTATTKFSREIGLKNGNLRVDDLRTGKQWTFEKINFSVTRHGRGGIVFNLGSENEERPWRLTRRRRRRPATSGATSRSRRARCRRKDLLLAMRLDEGDFQADMPICRRDPRRNRRRRHCRRWSRAASSPRRARSATRRIEDASIEIDKAEITLDWDATRRSLVAAVPDRFGRKPLHAARPARGAAEPRTPWRLTLTGGTIVLGSPQSADEAPLVLNRILMRASSIPRRSASSSSRATSRQRRHASRCPAAWIFPPASRGCRRPGRHADDRQSRDEAHLAGLRRLQGAHLGDGQCSGRRRVERLDDRGQCADRNVEGGRAADPRRRPVGRDRQRNATRASRSPACRRSAKPISTTRITGRNVRDQRRARRWSNLHPAASSSVTNGVFEIPDTHPKAPPARARFRIDGPVAGGGRTAGAGPVARSLRHCRSIRRPAAAMSAGRCRVGCRSSSDLPQERAQLRHQRSTVSNFAADKMVMGQKVEAQTLKVAANNQGYQIKGDVRINGTPAALEYRKARNDGRCRSARAGRARRGRARAARL